MVRTPLCTVLIILQVQYNKTRATSGRREVCKPLLVSRKLSCFIITFLILLSKQTVSAANSCESLLCQLCYHVHLVNMLWLTLLNRMLLIIFTFCRKRSCWKYRISTSFSGDEAGRVRINKCLGVKCIVFISNLLSMVNIYQDGIININLTFLGWSVGFRKKHFSIFNDHLKRFLLATYVTTNYVSGLSLCHLQ